MLFKVCVYTSDNDCMPSSCSLDEDLIFFDDSERLLLLFFDRRCWTKLLRRRRLLWRDCIEEIARVLMLQVEILSDAPSKKAILRSYAVQAFIGILSTLVFAFNFLHEAIEFSN